MIGAWDQRKTYPHRWASAFPETPSYLHMPLRCSSVPSIVYVHCQINWYLGRSRERERERDLKLRTDDSNSNVGEEVVEVFRGFGFRRRFSKSWYEIQMCNHELMMMNAIQIPNLNYKSNLNSPGTYILWHWRLVEWVVVGFQEKAALPICGAFGEKMDSWGNVRRAEEASMDEEEAFLSSNVFFSELGKGGGLTVKAIETSRIC